MDLCLGHMHQVGFSGSGRGVNLMVGVPADSGALKLLFHDTSVWRNGNLVGEWQAQVSQAVKGIPAKVPVEVQNAMTHYKTGFATFPNIISQIAKESGDSGGSEIDAP